MVTFTYNVKHQYYCVYSELNKSANSLTFQGQTKSKKVELRMKSLTHSYIQMNNPFSIFSCSNFYLSSSLAQML